APDVDNCLDVVSACAGRNGTKLVRSPATDECFDRARSLAKTCSDWLAIAADLHQHDYAGQDVRAALLRAKAAATPAALRTVARAMRDQGGDPAAAAAIAPRALGPHELAPPSPSPLGWQRD